MRVQQIQHLLRFRPFSVFSIHRKAKPLYSKRFLFEHPANKALFNKKCYTFLADLDSKIYLVKTVANCG